jgi:hypothetical protein
MIRRKFVSPISAFSQARVWIKESIGSLSFVIPPHARTGTLAVRSSFPQLTQAPLIARRIAFQMQ